MILTLSVICSSFLHCKKVAAFELKSRIYHWLSMNASSACLFPDIEIGYSDHVPPHHHNICLVSAYNMGAKIIEKHFTFDKKQPGNDHYHASDLADATLLTEQLKIVDTLMSDGDLQVDNQLSARKHARRSLVCRTEIKPGDFLSHENITALRPANGISPALWLTIKGKIAIKSLTKGALLQQGDFE